MCCSICRSMQTGNVSDARVVSGPEELRKTALQSVLQWHFARESGRLHAPGHHHLLSDDGALR